MSSKPSPAPKAEILMTGIAMGESPRWHENRLWFSDWGAQEIIAVDLHGKSEVMAQVSFGLPFCIDWLRDGRLLVVSGQEGLLFRRERDGSLATHADLHGPAGMGWNEIVVDGRGNVYINGGSGMVLLRPDGSIRQVADNLAFPNGMAITPDNLTLIIAESYGKKLSAFDIAADGGLSNRRVWADLGGGVPDGICIDADGAVSSPISAACASAKAVRSCRPWRLTAAVSRACSAAWRRERCSSSPPSGAAWTELPKWRKRAPDRCLRSRRPHPTPVGHRN